MHFPEISKTIPAWIIGAIAVLLIMHRFWAAADGMYQGRMEVQAESEVHKIIYGFKNLSGGNLTDHGSSNLVPIAIATNICAPDMVLPNVMDYCLGPWGKDNKIEITSNPGLRDFDNTININILGLSQDACKNLSTAFATTNEGLEYARINDLQVFLAGPKKTVPFDKAGISRACNHRDKTNSILLTYSVQ